MAAYAYPIKINRRRQRIDYVDRRDVLVTGGYLTLSDLSFLNEDDSFSIAFVDTNMYEVDILRSRLETKEERDTRVAREESYMTEYEKRRRMQSAHVRQLREGQ